MGKFEDAVSKNVYEGFVKKQMSEGSLVGTRGTPAFYINGRFLSGAQPIASFKRVIDEELKKAEEMVKKGVAKNQIYNTIMKTAERKLAAGAPQQQQQRPGSPDPAKVYFNDIKTGPMKGVNDALVTIVEYSDFQCPFCSRVEPTMDRILKEYAGKVKIVWMNNPLGFHKNAMPAAQASYAIYKLKGDAAFWKAHKKFFENAKNLTPELYTQTAKELGVDMGKFEDAISKNVYEGIVKSQQSQGARIGARGTPAFFINGRFLSGARPFEHFKTLIDEELKKAEEMVKKGTPKSKIYETLMKNAEKSVK
jgi:protein-disulfide isomerase